MATLRDTKYRDKQVIVDSKGNVVDLGQLERNFSPTIDESGEEVTNPKLQAFIDNPELADIEAASATLQEGPGQTTNLNRSLSEEKPLIFDQDPMQRREMPPGKIANASQVMQDYGQQRTQPMDFASERQAFKTEVINQKFGGNDPYKFDPMEELDNIDPGHFQREYEKYRQATMGPMWHDLEDKQRADFVKNERSRVFDKLKAATEFKVAEMKEIMGEYDRQAARREKQMEKLEATQEKLFKEAKAETEARRKEKQARPKRKLDLYSEMLETQQQIQNAYSGTDTTALKQKMLVIQKALGDIAEEEKSEVIKKKQKQSKQPFIPKPGKRTKGHPTKAIIEQYLSLTGNDYRATLQMLENDGYNTDFPRK
jgi:hypothetical protein